MNHRQRCVYYRSRVSAIISMIRCDVLLINSITHAYLQAERNSCFELSAVTGFTMMLRA
jgi:hypothetical protein